MQPAQVADSQFSETVLAKKPGRSLLQETVDCAHRHFVSLQVVINNAGVYGAKINLETVTADDMLFTYRANTIGPLLIVQQLLKNKLIGKPGSLVGNVTSKVPGWS